jgi:hypothetical protein
MMMVKDDEILAGPTQARTGHTDTQHARGKAELSTAIARTNQPKVASSMLPLNT